MKNYWLMAGLLSNSALIVIDRYLVSLPDWLYIGVSIIAIVCMIAGAVKAK